MHIKVLKAVLWDLDVFNLHTHTKIRNTNLIPVAMDSPNLSPYR